MKFVKVGLLASLGAALALSTGQAQSNQSYIVNLPVDGGFVAIANQLDHGSNTLDEVITNVPDGTTLLKWDCTTQDWHPNAYNYFAGLGWFPTGGTLSPGEGGFISAPGGATITFTGTPHVPVLPAALSCSYGGAHFLSRQTNGPGTYENITGRVPAEGAQVRRWNVAAQGFFDTETYTNGAWSPSVPELGIGEAALFVVQAAPVELSYTVSIQAGLNLIANHLDHGSNRLSQIFSYLDHGSNTLAYLPPGTVFYKHENASGTWKMSSFFDVWDDPAITLNPGEGAFLYSPTNFTLTFSGTPHVPVLPVTIPAGAAYLLSRQTNEVGSYENIVGTSPPSGAKVYRWDPNLQGYVSYTKTGFGSGWSPSIPSVAVGESIWIAPAGGTPLYPPPFLECATNKTVDCGSVWTFDPPVAIGGCSTNVTLTVLGTVTDGASCPPTVTRTWLVTDACGGSNTCSQTVSSQDTVPPVIVCASNKVVSCVAGTSANGFELLTLRSFSTNGTDGVAPRCWLTEGTDGALYGTTTHGGLNDAGTLFKINKAGGAYTVLHSFATNGTDGQSPDNGLVEGRDGALYGTTSSGGTSNAGTIFKLNQDGSGYAVLRNLGSSGNDGMDPSGLMEGSDGALYGTTTLGGNSNAGTIFKLNKDGSGYQRIANLGSSGQDGVAPYGRLVEGSDGAIYGTTSLGGSSGAGTVFKLNKDGSGYLTVANLGSSGQDGVQPYAGLVEGSDGALYGTTSLGGTSNAGTIFKLNRDGSGYQRIANLGSNEQDGVSPYGGLTEGRDGALYGTTTLGGSSNAGTIFKLNKDGSGYQRIANLGSSGQDGVAPYGRLVEASDGVFYGATSIGGTNNAGIVFRLQPPCAWSFDPPTATDACCGTNVTITILSTTTNSPVGGAQAITRTWLATDCCSNSASCSQTVTLVNPSFPVITSQPQSLTVTQGQNATFTIGVLGEFPLAFGWFHNDTRVLWAEDDRHVVSNAQPADAGDYYCVVSNSLGSVTSQVVTLTVVPDTFPPVLVSAVAHCASNSVTVNFNEPMDAVSAGEPFNYQISGGVTVQSAVLAGDGQTVFLYTDPLTVGVAYILTVDNLFDLAGNSIAAGSQVTFECPIPCVTFCATNKTVECGSTWTFDAPTNSCTNVTVAEITAFTNETCPQSVTRLWSVVDSSGASNSCSQTVTVTDTIPPTLAGVPAGGALGCNPPTLPTDADVLAQVSATDACGSASVQVSHVDGGTACARTRTFSIIATDSCGNSSAPQMVVYSWKADTLPPVVNCPTEPIMLQKPKPECLNVIKVPKISFNASDNCSSYKQLTFTQVPAANVEVPGRSVVVTVTVTDQCGNATTCLVTVLAYDRTRPVLELDRTHLQPKGPLLTLTNCDVPDLLPFVSATDNCGCPVVIEQIPAGGTVVHAPNPPAHSLNVTFKATDCAGNVTLRSFPLGLPSSHSAPPGLQALPVWNTGVDEDGNLLVPGEPDLHYQLIEAPSGYSPWPATPVAAPPNSPWGSLGSSSSAWIAPVAAPAWDSSTCPPGVYHYQTTFVLPQFVDPDTAVLSGRWAADNDARFFFNGADRDTILHAQSHDGWSSWNNFSFGKPKPPSGGSFLAYPNVNTLDFYVTNLTDSTTGLRVELKGYSACGVCDPPVIVFITDSQRLRDEDKYGNTMEVQVIGTPSMSYQWYHNNVALTEQNQSGPYHGVQSHRLRVKYSQHSGPSLADLAGMYTVVVSNECGSATASTMLTVQIKKPPQGGRARLANSTEDGDWAAWRFDVVEDPLAGNPGPSLLVQGTNSLALGFGTTEDFELPPPSGIPVSLLSLPALLPDTTLRLPSITDSNLTSYTVLFDLHSPSNSSGQVRTLFANQGSTNGGFAWTIDAQNHLRLSGTVGGASITAASIGTVPPETWTRVGLVVDITEGEPSLQMYFDGQPDGLALPAVTGDLIPGLDLDLNSSNRAALILSSTTGENAPLFVAGVFLKAVALAPQLMAAYGGSDVGELIEIGSVSGGSPVLTVTRTGDCLNLIWTGDPYALQETDDLNSGSWRDSVVPFISEDVGGVIRNTACVTPALNVRQRFFRLTYRP